jgi:hypothetical protein
VSVGQLVGRSVSWSVGQLVGHLFSGSVGSLVGLLVCLFIQWVDVLAGQPASETLLRLGILT